MKLSSAYATEMVGWTLPGAQIRIQRIVVVDSHPIIMAALKVVLERNTMLKVVDFAKDGTSGLQKYHQHRPDLLIVDLNLSQLDTIDLISRIRMKDSCIRILVFSACKLSFVVDRARRAGANGFLCKSESEKEIHFAVSAVIHGQNVFDDHDKNPTARPPSDVVDRLSKRELTILGCLARGQSNKDIALAFSLSSKTVSSHKIQILSKLGLDNVVELAEFAKTHHLVE